MGQQPSNWPSGKQLFRRRSRLTNVCGRVCELRMPVLTALWERPALVTASGRKSCPAGSQALTPQPLWGTWQTSAPILFLSFLSLTAARGGLSLGTETASASQWFGSSTLEVILEVILEVPS